MISIVKKTLKFILNLISGITYKLINIYRLLLCQNGVFYKYVTSILYHLNWFKFIKKEIYGLHLGSGGLYIPQFCNIDANIFTPSDIIANIEKLKMHSNTVSVIYASHVFEHIPKKKAELVLSEWHRVLKNGGKLYICVPDNEVLFKLYLDNLPRYQTNEGRYIVDLSCGVIYGGQVNKYDFHYYGYSFNTLSSMLLLVGFSKIQVFNREGDNLFPFHDASFAKINDIPVSLNIEATK